MQLGTVEPQSYRLRIGADRLGSLGAFAPNKYYVSRESAVPRVWGSCISQGVVFLPWQAVASGEH